MQANNRGGCPRRAGWQGCSGPQRGQCRQGQPPSRPFPRRQAARSRLQNQWPQGVMDGCSSMSMQMAHLQGVGGEGHAARRRGKERGGQTEQRRDAWPRRTQWCVLFNTCNALRSRETCRAPDALQVPLTPPRAPPARGRRRRRRPAARRRPARGAAAAGPPRRQTAGRSPPGPVASGCRLPHGQHAARWEERTSGAAVRSRRIMRRRGRGRRHVAGRGH
jgi:hypothetical protein